MKVKAVRRKMNSNQRSMFTANNFNSNNSTENSFFSLRRSKNNRSNSLERRKSGDGDSIINQSTVHGIASPSRRPTIFDVFRPRSKSDAKRKERELAKAHSTDKDSHSASGSSTHSGSGGLMHSMKAAMQHTMGTRESKSKTKDGSAHPHGGSDAQYYHTVTAVRRIDHAKSPMTKMMDLFRHRSNSAVSEAEKRKAVRILVDIEISIEYDQDYFTDFHFYS